MLPPSPGPALLHSGHVHRHQSKRRQSPIRATRRAGRALLHGESDRIANAANLSALVYHALPSLNWAGFYFFDGTELVVGPFQGLPACVRIPLDRASAAPPPAAATRSAWTTCTLSRPHRLRRGLALELVVPLVKDGALVGVFDLDSPDPARFDVIDQQDRNHRCHLRRGAAMNAPPSCATSDRNAAGCASRPAHAREPEAAGRSMPSCASARRLQAQPQHALRAGRRAAGLPLAGGAGSAPRGTGQRAEPPSRCCRHRAAARPPRRSPTPTCSNNPPPPRSASSRRRAAPAAAATTDPGQQPRLLQSRLLRGGPRTLVPGLKREAGDAGVAHRNAAIPALPPQR